MQVFLGGACGATTWRRDIAIPLLDSAGITYHDPQLGPGEWTAACEAAEMAAKDGAEVLLFVIHEATRGVASVAEAAFYMGQGRPLALTVMDAGAAFGPGERDDLNRGRLFLRTMARECGVPVFADVAPAVGHAIDLVRAAREPLTAVRVRAILDEVHFEDARFVVEEGADGLLIHMHCRDYDGRRWHVGASATRGEIVQTALKAVLTWQEHEARESFTYRGVPVFNPHTRLEGLWRLNAGWPRKQGPQ